jgi:hypothetical protein
MEVACRWVMGWYGVMGDEVGWARCMYVAVFYFVGLDRIRKACLG